MKKLREKWPWNKEFLQIFLIVPVLICIVLSALLLPAYGVHSLYFLLAAPCSILFRLIYGIVGKKVAALKESLPVQDGEAAESLMVIGKIQSPGIAVLRESELILVPIVGERCTIMLADIKSVREGSWLPGKYVWGKRAFIIKTSDKRHFAVAVAESVGKHWSKQICISNAR